MDKFKGMIDLTTVTGMEDFLGLCFEQVTDERVIFVETAKELDDIDEAVYDTAGQSLNEMTIYTPDGYIRTVYFDKPSYMPEFWENILKEEAEETKKKDSQLSIAK